MTVTTPVLRTWKEGVRSIPPSHLTVVRQFWSLGESYQNDDVVIKKNSPGSSDVFGNRFRQSDNVLKPFEVA
ncbi:MAG: hypothetical protein AAGD34_08000 [Pseudomonadota bacterium]